VRGRLRRRAALWLPAVLQPSRLQGRLLPTCCELHDRAHRPKALEAKRRGGKTTGGRNATQAGRSRGGKAAQAVLRAKPAAERAATAQKGWAPRRAKAAAAQLAELEAEGRAMDAEGRLVEKDKVGRGRAARLPPFAVRAAGALRSRAPGPRFGGEACRRPPLTANGGRPGPSPFASRLALYSGTRGSRAHPAAPSARPLTTPPAPLSACCRGSDGAEVEGPSSGPAPYAVAA
jgi:hypothetical protein